LQAVETWLVIGDRRDHESLISGRFRVL